VPRVAQAWTPRAPEMGRDSGIWHRKRARAASPREKRQEGRRGREEYTRQRPLMTSIVVSVTRSRVFTKLCSPAFNDTFTRERCRGCQTNRPQIARSSSNSEIKTTTVWRVDRHRAPRGIRLLIIFVK